MLPKPEKPTKKNNSEQLNFIDPLDDEKRIRRKRKVVIIFLVLTVGSSFAFWTYSNVQKFLTGFNPKAISFNLSLPKINIPATDLNVQPELKSQLHKILSDQNPKWTIYIQTLESPTPFSWSYNAPNDFITNLDPIISEVLLIESTTNSIISKTLPPGVQIKEKILNPPNSYEVYYIISVPNKKIFMAFKTENVSDLEKSKQTIPLLAEKIYWQLIKLD